MTESWEVFLKKLVELIGFTNYHVEVDEASGHGTLTIYDDAPFVSDQAPVIVSSMNHLLQLIGQKHGKPSMFVDVNNYRKERDRLITELARAAARKVMATKAAISLPAMNAYERRLVHVELATHPSVKTESQGDGKGRFVEVKPVE